MKVMGDIKLLKQEIEKKYIDELNSFEKMKSEDFHIKSEIKSKKYKKQLVDLTKNIEKEKQKIYYKTVSLNTLKHKEEFEIKRNEIIKKIFDESQKRSKEILTSSKYISNVKKNIKKNVTQEIKGGFNEYRDKFEEIEIDTAVDGIIIKQENISLDFTLKTFLESNKDSLKLKLREILR